MNTMSTLQTVARLDSERVFRAVIDAAMGTGTEQLLEWVRFQPEQFGIDTPRHVPIFAKKVVLPHYALLSDDAQSDTVEKICEQLETDSGMFFTYALDASAGIISIYVASVEVDATTLIDLFESLDEELDDDDDDEELEDEGEDPDFLFEPELLIGTDVLVNDLLRTVMEVDASEMTALLDDGSTIDFFDIKVDSLDGSYFIPAPENFGVDRSVENAARDARTSQVHEDDEDDEEEDEDDFPEEPAVVVPQIRDAVEAVENTNDDDFPEEELQQAETVNEDQALAAAIAEEQNEQAEVQATEPAVEAPASAVETADDTFAEEEQSEVTESAQTETQAPTEAPVETASAVEGVSESEMARRTELLESVKEQLPNDSVSEIKDNVLTVFMVKDDKDYELTITLTQQLFAGERMIDIFVLASKDGTIGKRSTNAAAVLAAIDDL